VATSDDRRGKHGRPNYWTRRAVVGGIVAVPVAAVAWSIERSLSPSGDSKHPGTGTPTDSTAAGTSPGPRPHRDG